MSNKVVIEYYNGDIETIERKNQEFDAIDFSDDGRWFVITPDEYGDSYTYGTGAIRKITKLDTTDQESDEDVSEEASETTIKFKKAPDVSK